MPQYTARNGTTFCSERDGRLFVTGAEIDESGITLDISDIREFLEHIEQPQGESDSDVAAVSED